LALEKGMKTRKLEPIKDTYKKNKRVREFDCVCAANVFVPSQKKNVENQTNKQIKLV